MVCLLQESVLHQIAKYQLSTSRFTNGSWIMRVRDLCILYGLPSPLAMLQDPIPKPKFKALVKSRVVDYWEVKLRSDALSLSSLKFFHPHYMSLLKPHPLWTTCGANPFEVNKAIVQARMLSGRYPTDKLVRHWSKNKSCVCLLLGCSGSALGSLEHLLLLHLLTLVWSLYPLVLLQCTHKLQISSRLSHVLLPPAHMLAKGSNKLMFRTF